MVFLRWCRFWDRISDLGEGIHTAAMWLLFLGGKKINKAIQFLIESEKWKKKSHFRSAITFYVTLNLRTKNKPWNANTLQENHDTWHPKSQLSSNFQPFYLLSFPSQIDDSAKFTDFLCVTFPPVAFSDGRLFRCPFPGLLSITSVLLSLHCFLQQIQGDENAAMEHTLANRALPLGIIAVVKNKNLK